MLMYLLLIHLVIRKTGIKIKEIQDLKFDFYTSTIDQ